MPFYSVCGLGLVSGGQLSFLSPLIPSPANLPGDRLRAACHSAAALETGFTFFIPVASSHPPVAFF